MIAILLLEINPYSRDQSKIDYIYIFASLKGNGSTVHPKYDEVFITR